MTAQQIDVLKEALTQLYEVTQKIESLLAEATTETTADDTNEPVAPEK